MKATTLVSCVAAFSTLLLCGCEGDGKVTEEAASEAGKVLKAWQDQNK